MPEAPSATPPPFAEVVRFHRARAGLTQLDLARLAGVGKTVVFDIEKGKATVRLSTLLRVLRALNIRLDWQSPLRAAFEASHAQDAARDAAAAAGGRRKEP